MSFALACHRVESNMTAILRSHLGRMCDVGVYQLTAFYVTFCDAHNRGLSWGLSRGLCRVMDLGTCVLWVACCDAQNSGLCTGSNLRIFINH